jgi:phosphoribosylglycinamide formyltransferase-1
MVVLAGWKLILPDAFLHELQRLEIAVINLHPALLSRREESHVATSRGRIPVLRGANAIHDAFELNLRVSGVTVHQVLPNALHDTGPIVLKEEVARKAGEPWSAWEARMHETEHRVLPAALKRVLHVIRHGIDVSAGQFPW